MRLVTFSRDGGAAEAGIMVEEDALASLSGLGYSRVIDVLADGADALARLRAFAASGPPRIGLDKVKLMAPVPRPPKLICVGLNYRDHAAETHMQIPAVPTIFNKFPNVVIGPGEPIVLPSDSAKPDYEAELAFVIGRGGRRIPAGRWREHVAGYTIANDVSARDFQAATTQWLMGKTFDTFAPMGPWLVTADEMADPQALDISLSIGGEVLQDSNTREMIFPIPELVAYISGVVTLEPGDVVLTGTPRGVGMARKPPRWLRPGDEVTIRIAGLGELRNPVTAE